MVCRINIISTFIVIFCIAHSFTRLNFSPNWKWVSRLGKNGHKAQALNPLQSSTVNSSFEFFHYLLSTHTFIKRELILFSLFSSCLHCKLFLLSFVASIAHHSSRLVFPQKLAKLAQWCMEKQVGCWLNLFTSSWWQSGRQKREKMSGSKIFRAAMWNGGRKVKRAEDELKRCGKKEVERERRIYNMNRVFLFIPHHPLLSTPVLFFLEAFKMPV